MERIWAPWRMLYLKAHPPAACVFCPAPEGDRERHILHRGDHAFVIMNRYPYSSGHLMVAPFRHTGELAELDDKELLELMQLVRRCTFVLKKAMGPQGFNVGINIGQAGGAGIAEHLHIHVVPRWSGDANFMSVLADARVIPEGLDSTYERLLPLFHYSDHDREKGAP